MQQYKHIKTLEGEESGETPRPMLVSGNNEPSVAWLMEEKDVKACFPLRFVKTDCTLAFPDQRYTFIGDCSTASQAVALVPGGDVRFTSNKVKGLCLVAVVSDLVSACYLDFLEEMQISYIFAGASGLNENLIRRHLAHDFGVREIRPFCEYPNYLGK